MTVHKTILPTHCSPHSAVCYRAPVITDAKYSESAHLWDSKRESHSKSCHLSVGPIASRLNQRYWSCNYYFCVPFDVGYEGITLFKKLEI